MTRNGTYKHPFLLTVDQPGPSHVAVDRDPLVLYDIAKPEINLAVWVPDYPQSAWNYLASIGRDLDPPGRPWFPYRYKRLDNERVARLHPQREACDPYISLYEQAKDRWRQALPSGRGRSVVADTLGQAAVHFSLLSQSRRLHMLFRQRRLQGRAGPDETSPHTDGLGLQLFCALNEGGLRIINADAKDLRIPSEIKSFHQRYYQHKRLPWAKLRGAIWELPTGAIAIMKGHGWPNPILHTAAPRAGARSNAPDRLGCFVTGARGRFSGEKRYQSTRPLSL
jgi:hypothetical protein